MSDDDKCERELALDTRLMERRLATLGAQRAAFEPWPPPRIPRGEPTPLEHRTLLEAVTQRKRQSVGRITDAPAGRVSVAPVRSRLVPPRSLDPGHAGASWYGQLETAFLLHLPGGFFGDNVVFDADRYYDFDRWWLRGSWAYSGVDQVRRIDAGISIAAWGGEAFQHFAVDALPRLGAVIDLLELPELRHVQIVSHADGARAASWFWQALGLSDRIVQKPRSAREGFVIHANHVLYLDFEPSLGVEGVYPRDVLRPVQLRLGVLDPVPRDRVLYLSRGSSGRTVADERGLLARIESALSGSGLRLEVSLRRGDLDRDRDLVRRARVILGPHGGAFGNLVFAQPGTHVIEFIPSYDLPRLGEDARPMYWGLSQAAGLDYWTVTPKRFGFDARDIEVDPEDVLAVLRRVLPELRGGRDGAPRQG